MMQQASARPTTAALLRYFLYLGRFGFGGPVALVGYMQRDLVEQRGWFAREEYLKSLALLPARPRPPRRAGRHLPRLHPLQRVFVVIPWRWFDRFSENPQVKAFVGGVTAAASGAIAGACFVLALRAIVDVPALLIALGAFGVVLRFKVPEPFLIAAEAAAGLGLATVR